MSVEMHAVLRVGSIFRSFDRLRKMDKRKVFREARKPTRVDQRKHDKEAQGPSGRWPPLASTTLERRSRGKRGRKSRKILGRLPRALLFRHDDKHLVVTSRARKKIVLTHQKGATVGHGARVPERRFLWISSWLVREVKTLFERALVAAWRR